MKNLRILLLIGCLVYLGAFLAPKAKADELDQKTIITFDQPVELPGNVVLPAGTYVFKLMGSPGDRNIVQVLNQDEKKVYATINAIPDYREHATGENLIVLQDRPAGAPRAIKEWFFRDRRYGHEFVYPKSLQLAKTDEPDNANKPAESAEPQSTEVQSMKNEPATVEHSEQTMPPSEPEQAETQLPPQPEQEAEAQLPPQSEQEAEAQQPPQSAMARELPKTASLLPLTGLLGMLLVAVAFGLRLYSGKID